MINQVLLLVLSKEELSRIEINMENNLVVDIHSLSRGKAKRFLRNVVALIRCPFTMTVIHGYRGGTILMDVLRTEKVFKRDYKMKPNNHNLGRTDFYFKQLEI